MNRLEELVEMNDRYASSVSKLSKLKVAQKDLQAIVDLMPLRSEGRGKYVDQLQTGLEVIVRGENHCVNLRVERWALAIKIVVVERWIPILAESAVMAGGLCGVQWFFIS